MPGGAALEREGALSGHTGQVARKILPCQSLLPWTAHFVQRNVKSIYVCKLARPGGLTWGTVTGCRHSLVGKTPKGGGCVVT